MRSGPHGEIRILYDYLRAEDPLRGELARSRELLRKRNPPVRRAIIVAHLRRQRRVYLTCVKHLFPAEMVNSPPLSWKLTSR